MSVLQCLLLFEVIDTNLIINSVISDIIKRFTFDCERVLPFCNSKVVGSTPTHVTVKRRV